MMIEMFIRTTGEYPYWILMFKAKYFSKTKTYVASLESFNHPHLLSETFVSVRCWESDNVRSTIPKDLLLADIERAKKRVGVETMMQLYEKWKGGENVDA